MRKNLKERAVESKAWRRGMTLVELLGVMVVIAILAAIAVGGISAARDNANITAVTSDMRTYDNALKQMLMLHPEVMKFTAAQPEAAVERLIAYINEQMEEQWSFVPIGNDTTGRNNDSGAIATTSIKRDAWGNPYCLYVYFDNLAPTYLDKSGTPLKDSDSCVYFVIASPGKNSTGVGLGVSGNNFDAASRKISDSMQCVNNTDGVDDLGIIVRVLNGDVYSATFGTDKSALGTLKGTQWCFGVPSTAGTVGSTSTHGGGVCYDFTNSATVTATAGGSIDRFYDQSTLDTYKTAGNSVAWIGGASQNTAPTTGGGGPSGS